MTASKKHASLASRLRHPQTTVRWRLTLLYGGLFLVCGAALLAITYTLVEHDTLTGNSTFTRAAYGQRYPATRSGGSPLTGNQRVQQPPSFRQSAAVPPPIKALLGSEKGRKAILIVGSQQRLSDLHQLIVESSIALAIMALISGLLGWLMAGRVLRPLRTMTATTQQISEANLNRRLALQGPRDELRELADTIDGLLERLEGAFDAQRRFVANASHELRTPLTAARALLEMVLTDPHATVQTFRATCRQVLEEGEQQEQLIDALLALAQGQRGIEHRERLDLAAIVGEVLQTQQPDAVARGLELNAALKAAPVSGDRRLIERLTCNLVQNAIRYNTPGGSVQVWVERHAGEATLAIANTGPLIRTDQIDRLLQPFARLTPDRTGQGDGFGLGLSIVSSIARAHEASLDVRPGRNGGLRIEVRFPRPPEAELQPPPPEDSLVLGPGADQLALSPPG